MNLRNALSIVLAFSLIGCNRAGINEESGRQQTYQPNSNQTVSSYNPKDHIAVRTLKGEQTTLDLDEQTLVVGIATWCPHSKNFVKTITNPTIKPIFQRYTWVFVVTEDEWPSVRRQLVEMEKSGELNGRSAESVLQQLKVKAGNGPLFDPELLDTLPGKTFILPANSNTKLKSYPALYSRTTGTFDSHAMEWVRDHSMAAFDLYQKYENEPQEQ